MTQDPNLPPASIPYGPPRGFRPASRVGWLMLSIGIFMLLGGGLFIAFGFFLPVAQLQPDQAQKLKQLEAQLHMSLTAVFVTAGSIAAIAGLYHIVMSFFVRQGWRGAIYTSIVTSFLVIGWCVLSTINGMVYGGADAALGVCFLGVIATIFIWLIVWLLQALRGSSTSAAFAAQYQARYWQMLQQQQAYGQPQGMSVPPPPMGAISPPPPPQPPSPDVTGWAYGPQTPPPPPPTGSN